MNVKVGDIVYWPSSSLVSISYGDRGRVVSVRPDSTIYVNWWFNKKSYKVLKKDSSLMEIE